VGEELRRGPADSGPGGGAEVLRGPRKAAKPEEPGPQA